MFSNVTIAIKSTLRITTSGYSDRYCSSTTTAVLRKSEIPFTVPIDDLLAALLELSGVDPADSANQAAAHHAVMEARRHAFSLISWRTPDRSRFGVVKSTAARINAGIRWACRKAEDFAKFTPEYWAEAEKIVATLSREERLAIISGLEDCNRVNAEAGKPVVEFESLGIEEEK